MRLISALFMCVVLATLAGCGSKSGPVTPAKASAEQEQQIKEQQQSVNAEERQQVGKQAGTPTRQQQVNLEEEQYRRQNRR
jgi:predicted small lipoprotein YifL